VAEAGRVQMEHSACRWEDIAFDGTLKHWSSGETPPGLAELLSLTETEDRRGIDPVD
jgi:hypothetical protein